MPPRRSARGLFEGPLAFWTLVLLFILAVYGGFRAMSPRRASSASPAAPAQPTETAAVAGLNPLQLKKPDSPVVPTASTVAGAPVPAPKGIGLKPEEVAARLRQGCPSIVAFFSTESLSSREMFPQLVKLSQWNDAPEVIAFATDQDASAVDTFLRVHRAGFNAALLFPAKPGELAAALSEAEIGIKVGKQLNLPLVAVLGPDCKVLGQWPGITDLGPVAVVLRKALQPVEATEEGEAE